MGDFNERRFEIITRSGVVSAELHGNHTAKSMISCIDKLKEKKQFKQKAGAVLNLTDAALKESFCDLLDMIDYTNSVANTSGPSKLAFVSKETTNPDFLDRFIVLTDDSHIHVKRFHQDAEAHQWVKSAQQLKPPVQQVPKNTRLQY